MAVQYVIIFMEVSVVVIVVVSTCSFCIILFGTEHAKDQTGKEIGGSGGIGEDEDDDPDNEEGNEDDRANDAGTRITRAKVQSVGKGNNIDCFRNNNRVFSF